MLPEFRHITEMLILGIASKYVSLKTGCMKQYVMGSISEIIKNMFPDCHCTRIQFQVN